MISDSQLSAALRDRNPVALSALYDRYATLCYSAIFEIVGKPQLAEDLLEETFLRAWTGPYIQLPDHGQFLCWMVAIARDQAIDYLRCFNRCGQEHAICEEKKHFVDRFDEASRLLAAASALLAGSIGAAAKPDYESLRTKATTARVRADSARVRMREHIADHGC